MVVKLDQILQASSRNVRSSINLRTTLRQCILQMGLSSQKQPMQRVHISQNSQSAKPSPPEHAGQRDSLEPLSHAQASTLQDTSASMLVVGEMMTSWAHGVMGVWSTSHKICSCSGVRLGRESGATSVSCRLHGTRRWLLAGWDVFCRISMEGCTTTAPHGGGGVLIEGNVSPGIKGSGTRRLSGGGSG